jgi:hypothetical protein
MQQTMYSFTIQSQIIELSYEELHKYPNSLFCRLASDTCAKKTKKGDILINRDNTFLEYVVTFIKHDLVPALTTLHPMIMKEARFYGLKELENKLNISKLQFDGTTKAVFANKLILKVFTHFLMTHNFPFILHSLKIIPCISPLIQTLLKALGNNKNRKFCFI